MKTMLINRVITGLIFSLAILFPLSYAFAQVPMFDQTVYVNEHSGILTITHIGISSNLITANLYAGSEGPIEINLYKIGNTDTFQSNFIKFSINENSVGGDYPVLNMSNSNSVEVEYDGTPHGVIATVEATSASLAPEDIAPRQSFTIVNSQNCDGDRNIYGGDTDGDYICNNWETEVNPETGEGPYHVNLHRSVGNSDYHLPTCDDSLDYNDDELGTSVCPDLTKRDMYIEIDYMRGHYPNVEALKKVVKAFLNAPDPINLHIFIDEEISHVNEIPFDTVDLGFDDIKAKKFGLLNDVEKQIVDGTWINSDDEIAKAQIFYYYIWTHDLTIIPHPSAMSESGGNDGIISLGSFDGRVGNTDQQAGTLMHELGHNLGLSHGGDDDENCKPNLLSVMSYSRQFSDLIERPLDYSRQSVGLMSDDTSLGWEDLLPGSGDGITGYSNCPYVSTTNQNDLDFDGIPDLCDLETKIISNTTLNGKSTLKGDLVIDPGVVLTIDSTGKLNFDSENHKILVNSTGGILIESGGKISGYLQTDDPVNNIPDSHENLPIVFGNGSGTTTVENTHQDDIPWPSDWRDIRWIKDIDGREVCPRPTIPIMLTSINEWDQISFSRISQHWSDGRSLGPLENDSTIPTSFSGNDEFTHAIPPVISILDLSLEDSGIDEFTQTKPSVKTLPDTEPTPERFDTHGKWCISLDDAKSQAKKWGLDIGRAPLCSNSEKDVEEAITVDNVRAARSVNVDNVLVIINKLNNQTDFENPTDKHELIGDLDKIRNYVLTDQMPEALEGYINFADSVTVKITSETDQQQILKVVDRNIIATSYAVPEFETISILILIVSIIAIIGISRKMRGEVFVQFTPNPKK